MKLVGVATYLSEKPFRSRIPSLLHPCTYHPSTVLVGLAQRSNISAPWERSPGTKKDKTAQRGNNANSPPHVHRHTTDNVNAGSLPYAVRVITRVLVDAYQRSVRISMLNGSHNKRSALRTLRYNVLVLWTQTEWKEQYATS